MKKNKDPIGLVLVAAFMLLISTLLVLSLSQPANAAAADIDAPELPAPSKLPDNEAGAKFNPKTETWTIDKDKCWLMFSYANRDQLYFVCRVEGLKL